MNTPKTQPIPTAQLREQGKRARARMLDRDKASSIIADRIIRSHEFAASKTLGCYLATRDEVDTSSIVLRSWRAKKRIFAPVTDSRGGMVFRELLPDTPLFKNRFGIWEPAIGTIISPKAIDVVIAPLVVFDEQRNRVGMGGGYYDRCFAFLAHRNHWLRPKLIGAAFNCQKVEKIVPNPWDIRLYRVFTESN